MALHLSSSQQVIDFLKSKSHDSSFRARKQIFNNHGLNKRLGDFVGSSSQNRSLLNLVSGLADRGITKFHEAGHTPVEEIQSGIERARATLSLAQAQKARDIEAGRPLTFEAGTALTPEEFRRQQAAPLTPTTVTPRAPAPQIQTFQPTPIPQAPTITAAEILERARARPEVQFGELETRLGREQIEEGRIAEREQVARQFEIAGLFQSGRRMSAQEAVDVAARGKEQDLNIGLARILNTAIERAQTELGKDFEEVVEAAKDRRKEELDFLKDLGLTVDPRTGEVFPTRQAQKDILAEERALRGEERADIRIEQAEERFLAAERQRFIQNERAQANLNIAEERLNIAKQKLNLVGQFLTGQQATQAFDDLLQNARQTLNENRGAVDGKIDPKIFSEFRKKVFKNMPSKLNDFDREFVPQLNPFDRERLNVITPGSGSNKEVLMQSLGDIKNQFILQEGLEIE